MYLKIYLGYIMDLSCSYIAPKFAENKTATYLLYEKRGGFIVYF
jgi:hypothetical protein